MNPRFHFYAARRPQTFPPNRERNGVIQCWIPANAGMAALHRQRLDMG